MRLLRESAMAIAVAATALATTPAAADDRGGPFGNMYPWSWQGAYAGVHAGFGEMDGGFAGGQIGYNWQNGKVIYGVEADLSLSGMEEDAPFGLASVSVDWFASVRGRVGYLVDPRILVYGTAGFMTVNGELEVFGVSDDFTETDFVVGLGIEGKINETMAARLELLTGDELDGEIIRAGLNFKLGR